MSKKRGREVLKRTHSPVVPRSTAVLRMSSIGRESDARNERGSDFGHLTLVACERFECAQRSTLISTWTLATA